MLVNRHVLYMYLGNINENCPEPCQEQHDEAMHFSDNDSDTDGDYMLEEDDAEDLSDDSDDGFSEDEEDEILYSVKRYYLLCIALYVI